MLFKIKKSKAWSPEIAEAERQVDEAYKELRVHLEELSASIEETRKLQIENVRKLQELSRQARA